jgi:Protein of unknown function (DUF3224)
MNSDNKKSRSNSRRATGASGKAFVALAILAVALLPSPVSALLPLPARQAGLKAGRPDAPIFIAASGSFIDCSFNSVVKQVGPNLIVTGDLTQTMYGTLDGCWTGSERDVVFLRTGAATFHGSGTFDGTVEGRSGTIVMSYEGTYDPQTNVATAHWVLAQGTDGLANLHGQGSWSGTFIDPVETPCTGDPSGCEGMFGATYGGTLNFAP